MHVRGNAVLPEKMVSRSYADHFTDIYCSLKVKNFPNFMVKFAFGQPTNHGSVGCGVNYI